MTQSKVLSLRTPDLAANGVSSWGRGRGVWEDEGGGGHQQRRLTGKPEMPPDLNRHPSEAKMALVENHCPRPYKTT